MGLEGHDRSERYMTRKALKRAGDVLKIGAAAYGIWQGASVFAATGDAVAATNSMAPAAMIYGLMNAHIVFNEDHLDRKARLLPTKGQYASRLAYFLLPAAQTFFMSDPAYSPILDLAPVVAAEVIVKPLMNFVDRKQQAKIAADMTDDELGEILAQLPVEKKREVVGSAIRKGLVKRHRF